MRTPRRLLALLITSPLLLSSSRAGQDDWVHNGRAVCVASGGQYEPVAVPDGAGGAIIIWQDHRSGTGDIYAQRVLSTGTLDPTWPSGALAVCLATDEQRRVAALSDGAGGALVAWEDFRNDPFSADIYAHHVLPTGVVDPAWPADGRAICLAIGDEWGAVLAPDDAGGALIAWTDTRTGGITDDIYAQHVFANGTVDPAWPVNGRALCHAAADQFRPAIVADGSGGAIVAWNDRRSGDLDIYAQRVLPSGVLDPAWPADGRGLAVAAGSQYDVALATDAAGGAIVTWGDGRTGPSDVYAQHLLPTGVVDASWPDSGRVLCAAVGSQVAPVIVEDGSGGAIVAWQDSRDGADDIYAQRVLASGAVDPAWPTGGRALCTASNLQMEAGITSDGAGGAIVAWEDYRVAGRIRLYAQHVLGSGAVDGAWPGDGRALGQAPGSQPSASIVTDNAGGVIVAWHDTRSDAGDIYAERIAACGEAAGTARCLLDGRLLCTAVGQQSVASIVEDGSGGAIVVWGDNRNGNWDLYAQRVQPSGAADDAWPGGGRALCLATGTENFHVVASDGAGGAVVAWVDARNGNDDIYVQRVTSTGAVSSGWPVDGRALCLATGPQSEPAIVADGSGGAIVTWRDPRAGASDIYAQRVLASGVVDPGWPSDGRALCLAAGNQQTPSIVSDGAGGAIVTWRDGRTGALQSDLFAQHVASNGVVDPAWPGDGRGICLAAGSQTSPVIVSDDAGGAIVAWTDSRNLKYDVYAARVLASGAMDPSWPADGRALCLASGDKYYTQLIRDGAGGGIVAWTDHRYGFGRVFAQHVLASGVLDAAWPNDGRELQTGGEAQRPSIASDGSGGAIVAWEDFRGPDIAVYAQHVLATGAVNGAWPSDGRGVCLAGEYRFNPRVASDGAGGAYVTWYDRRNGDYDVYVNRVAPGGSVLEVAPVVARTVLISAAWPNPFRSQLSVAFELPGSATMQLEVFDVAGRKLWGSRPASFGPGRHTLHWDGRASDGSTVGRGTYFLRVRGPGFASSRTVIHVK